MVAPQQIGPGFGNSTTSTTCLALFAVAGIASIILGALAVHHIHPFNHLSQKIAKTYKVCLLGVGCTAVISSIFLKIFQPTLYTRALKKEKELLEAEDGQAHPQLRAATLGHCDDKHVWISDQIIIAEKAEIYYALYPIKANYTQEFKDLIEWTICDIYENEAPLNVRLREMHTALQETAQNIQIVVRDFMNHFTCANHGNIIFKIGSIRKNNTPPFKFYYEDKKRKDITKCRVPPEHTLTQVVVVGGRYFQQYDVKPFIICRDPVEHLPSEVMKYILIPLAGGNDTSPMGMRMLGRLSKVSKSWRECVLQFEEYAKCIKMTNFQFNDEWFSIAHGVTKVCLANPTKLAMTMPDGYPWVTDVPSGACVKIRPTADRQEEVLLKNEQYTITQKDGKLIALYGKKRAVLDQGNQLRSPRTKRERYNRLFGLDKEKRVELGQEEWLAGRTLNRENYKIQLHKDRLLLTSPNGYNSQKIRILHLRNGEHEEHKGFYVNDYGLSYTFRWFNNRNQLQLFDSFLFCSGPEGGAIIHLPSSIYLITHNQNSIRYNLSPKGLAYRIRKQGSTSEINFPFADLYSLAHDYQYFPKDADLSL